jgi:tRNA(Ile)-lysidine synthetase-like protein
VGVSGGPDSMALLHLLASWCPGRVHAIIVDHQLRNESTSESVQVKQLIQKKGTHKILQVFLNMILKQFKLSSVFFCGLGIPVKIATIDWKTQLKELPAAQIEDHARIHRYRLLAHECRNLGVSKLFLGHHLNDQIETILYRLARASGLAGLRGMTEESCLPFNQHPKDKEISLFRPFLRFPKLRILKTCDNMGLSYLNDPMNNDPKFQRNIIRNLLKSVEDRKFLSEDDLARFCCHLSAYGETSTKFSKLNLFS